MVQEPDSIINHGTRYSIRTETPLIHSKAEMGRKLFPMSQNYLFLSSPFPTTENTMCFEQESDKSMQESCVLLFCSLALRVLGLGGLNEFLGRPISQTEHHRPAAGRSLSPSLGSRPVQGIKYSPEPCSFHLRDAFQSYPTERNHPCLRKLCRS